MVTKLEKSTVQRSQKLIGEVCWAMLCNQHKIPWKQISVGTCESTLLPWEDLEIVSVPKV